MNLSEEERDRVDESQNSRWDANKTEEIKHYNESSCATEKQMTKGIGGIQQKESMNHYRNLFDIILYRFRGVASFCICFKLWITFKCY